MSLKAEFDPLQHLVRPDQPPGPQANTAISSRQAPILLNQQAPARKSTLPTLRELRDLDKPVSCWPRPAQLPPQPSRHASIEQSRQNDSYDVDAIGYDDDATVVTVATVHSEAETVVHKNTRPSRKVARSVLTTTEDFDRQGLAPIEMIPEDDESDEKGNHHQEGTNTVHRETDQSDSDIAYYPNDDYSTCALGGTRERDGSGSSPKNIPASYKKEQEVNDEALARKLFQESVEEAIINTHAHRQTPDPSQPSSIPPAVAAHVDADEALARRIFANDIAQARRATKDTLDEKLVVEEPILPTDGMSELPPPFNTKNTNDSSQGIRTGRATTDSINRGEKASETKTKGRAKDVEGSQPLLHADALGGRDSTARPSMSKDKSTRPRNTPLKGPNTQAQAKTLRKPSATTTTETSTTSVRSTLSSGEGSLAGNQFPSSNRSAIPRNNTGRSVRSVAVGKASVGNAPRRSERYPSGSSGTRNKQLHQGGRSSQDKVRSKSLDLATDKKRKGIFEKFLHLGGGGSDCGSASPTSDDKSVQRVDEGAVSRPPLLEGSGTQSTVSSSVNRRNVRGSKGHMAGGEKSAVMQNHSTAIRRRGRSSSHDDILSLDPMTDSVPLTNLSRRTSRTNSSDNLSLNSDPPTHSAFHQQHSGPRRRCVGCNRMESHRMSFVELGDSKKRCACSSCCRTAQVDPEEVTRLWSCVLEFFEKELQLPVWDEMREISVALVSMDTMEEQMENRLSQCSHRSCPNILTQGLCLTAEHSGRRIKETCLLYDRTSRSFIECGAGRFFVVPDASKDDPYSSVTGILCVCGLPRELTISILCHEAVHAWLRLHPDTDILKPIPPAVEEGCCQLVAHRLLEALDRAEKMDRDSLLGSVSRNKQLRQQLKLRIESDESETFGQGYRAAAQTCSNVGIDVLMGNVAMYRDIIR